MTGWPPPAPAGAIFDLDGTLVDREPLTAAAAERVMADAGMPLRPTEAAGWTGRAWPDVHAELGVEAALGWSFASWHRRILTCADDLVAEGFEIRTLSGGVSLIEELRAAGVALAVATGSTAGELHAALVALGVTEHFTALVAAEDYERGKPAADPYLVAAARLGVEPAGCVAFEDSRPGVLSAISAGIATVVATSEANAPAGAPGHQDLSAAHQVVTDLGEVTVERLARWHDDATSRRRVVRSG